MSEKDLKFHGERCAHLKYGSIFVLLIGPIPGMVMLDHGGALWVIGGILVIFLALAGFIAMQARAEWHWDRFIENAGRELGDEHPLVEFGRRIGGRE